MTRMGPEALLMTSAIPAQRDLAEFTRLEYPHSDSRRMQATLLRDFEEMPTKRPMAGGLRRWGAKLLRRQDAGIAAAPAVLGEAIVLPVPPGTCLMAMPAMRAGTRSEEPPSSLPTLPRVSRV